MADPTRDESLSLLRWLLEAGADEAIVEQPVNRFAHHIPSPLVGEGGAPRAARAIGPPGEGVKVSSPLPEASLRQSATTRSTLPPAFAKASAGKQGEGRTISAQAVSLSTTPGAARALAASCTTLAELRTALGNFDGCELKRSAKNTVFADGAPDGRIMLIGEAPGRDEDEQGLPFVGRAGQLLDKMLAAIGLDRSKVYITNVLNWRPPQNRDPSPEEAAACLPFLHRHIELADPKLLILLGGVSVRHVLGLTDGILRLRGNWKFYQNGQLGRAIPVMPTLHPAYLLRQTAAKRLAWRDFLTISDKITELRLA
jgi:uracil-DNA glycosylase